MTKPPSHVLSSQNKLINQLVRRTKTLTALNQRVLPCLPQPLQNHCQVANFRPPVLVIEVDDTAWAMPLRFRTAELLRALHAKGITQVDQIKFILQKKHGSQ